MLGDNPQHLLLAPAGDQDRHPTDRRRVECAQPLLDPGQRFSQVGNAAPGRRELVPVLEKLAFLEPGTDTEDHPPVADVVDGPSHIGQQVGVAIAVATDQHPKVHPRGLLSQRSKRHPPFKVLAISIFPERKKVIPAEQRIRTDLLDLSGRSPNVRVVRPLRRQLHPDPHCSHEAPISCQTKHSTLSHTSFTPPAKEDRAELQPCCLTANPRAAWLGRGLVGRGFPGGRERVLCRSGTVHGEARCAVGVGGRRRDFEG
jgi:hypothetical protein